GSALHHLVTSVSVKKALMARGGFGALFSDDQGGDALGTHSVKMRGRTRLPDCAGMRVKE
ncbi:MAG: hypothetical protein PS018_05580, partial [bacterium]|nr:hypothetical protein [bacterium]